MTAGALRAQSADDRQSFGASQTPGGLDGLCRVFRRFASGRAPTSSFLSSGVRGALRCKEHVGSRICLWHSLELIAGRAAIRVYSSVAGGEEEQADGEFRTDQLTDLMRCPLPPIDLVDY